MKHEYAEEFEDDALKVTKEPEEQIMLQSVQIRFDAEIKPPPPVIQIDNMEINPVTIFTEGNISVIKGRAKARKSFAVAMFVASALSDAKLYRKFICVPKKLVIYFDTEQSSFYVQQAVRRIQYMANSTSMGSQFYCFALRKYNPQERLRLIEWVFEKFKGIGLVIIDGVRDLIKDINSPEESTMISSKLLKWSEQSGAHILTVLHENPSDGKLRGHIGTELMNKAETVLKVEKLQENPSYSMISCEMMRGLDFEPIVFAINDNIPEVVHGYVIQNQKGFS